MTTQIKDLNPLLRNNPNKVYRDNITKARLLKIASIANLIGIIIFSTILLFTIGTSASALPMAQLAIGISIPFLGVTYSIMNTVSKNCYKIASFYKKVIAELKELKKLSSYQIKNYLNKIKCYHPVDAKTTLPAIAHYRAWLKTKECFLEEINKIQQTETKDEKLKYILREQVHHMYEKEVLKAKLKAARAFNIINNPTDKKNLSHFGKIFIMNFPMRMDSFMRGDDTYFIFYDKIKDQRNRKGLSFTEVDEMEIHDISKLIFAS